MLSSRLRIRCLIALHRLVEPPSFNALNATRLFLSGAMLDKRSLDSDGPSSADANALVVLEIVSLLSHCAFVPSHNANHYEPAD